MIELKSGLTAEMLAEKDRGCATDPALPPAWAVELDLLIELDRICRKHGIRYFLDAGTLLGAVRHGGFIPWDDDIDIAMRRSDYDRFCRLAPMEFTKPYFFQDHLTDPGYPSYHAKIRNSLTTAIPFSDIRHGNCKRTYNQGIYIDVFPLDAVPEDHMARAALVRELCRLRAAKNRLIRRRAFFRQRRLKRFSELRDLFLGLPGHLIDRLTGHDSLAAVDRAYDACIRRYEGRSERLESLTIAEDRKGAPVRSVTDMAYETVVELPFEGFRFPVPAAYEKVLTEMFGDWRTPVRGTSAHRTLLIDVDRSYADYVRNGVSKEDFRRMSRQGGGS